MTDAEKKRLEELRKKEDMTEKDWEELRKLEKKEEAEAKPKKE
ncbi:MAG: hypothetical protein CH104c_0481 [Candidatus Woesebacteria bacterium]|nr:MAG: hypothetical protein CH104c_0481 [Candidatus Woesebacteria bacterium]